MKHTPLHTAHIELKGRMVEFGGWHMPIQYSSLVAEHKCVRENVGLFDVSHMGEILVSGKDAESFLQKATTNNVASLKIGQAQYSAICNNEGNPVDDILVYKRSSDSFLLCVNASNIQKDFEWLQSIKTTEKMSMENASESYAQIAVQGPKSRELVQKIVDTNIQSLPYYWFAEGKIMGVPGIISRTGYTGELGYELYIPAHAAEKIWYALLEAGKSFSVLPCGLGARDTLRLESGYLLYGNDMWAETSMLECGLGWITKFDKGEFIGSTKLIQQKEIGVAKKLVGFEMTDKAVARHGFSVFGSLNKTDSSIGVVTSASPSPTLGRNIGMAYVPNSLSKLGTQLFIDVRGELKSAVVVKKPFYTLGTAQS